MQNYRNLISDSTLVQEIVDLLRVRGPQIPAEIVAESILDLPDVEPQLAALVISDLIKDDGRLCVTANHMVELLCEDFEILPLKQIDFVIVDVETTGAKTPHSRIIEIGAYRIKESQVVAKFETLVNPQITIPPFITRLTGISNEMVKHAPTFSEIVHPWLEFLTDAVLVAHNASFDVRFLNHEISLIFPGKRMTNTQLCTVNLARRALPGLLNYRLHTIAEHFSITIHQRHRAGSDASATAEIFLHILKLLHQHSVTNLAEARKFRLSK
jgi:DNA polymerase III epsilon subunit family exonuclease